tara:strand:- start:13661 stop:14899 length:1239 start_codon:yes stop_codon:yes gene_type:complete
MTATIKIYLRDKPNKDKSYPIVLRVTKDRKSKILKLDHSCKKEQWDEQNRVFKKNLTDYRKMNLILLKKHQKALKIINDFIEGEINFTLNQFEAKFRGKEISKITVSEFWKEKIADLNKAGRTGNARAYQGTYNSFFKFEKNKNLVFREITPTLLDKYETYLRSNNNTDGGIGVKMRELRALYNDAIKKGVADNKYYPFEKFKVSKFKSQGQKKALTRAEMELMEALDTNKHPHLIDTKNYMIFSYYMGGMNFIDLMKLNWDNVEEDKIKYIRSKTKGRFSVKILDPVREILNYYKSQNRKTNYVFPLLLKEGLTPVQIENRKLKTLKMFNKQLKEIAKIQGVNQNVTSYVIRHSFATHLKFAGISTDLIGELMGHHDVSVTQAYLKGFDDEMKDDAMSRLLLKEPQWRYAS